MKELRMITIDTTKEWFSQKEAAKAYGISESTIKRARLNGELPYSTIFGKIIISKRDIERNITKVV